MEKNALLQYLTCPITKLIFCDPVLADDGNFYEFMAIKNHISKNNTSPVTGEKMGNVLVRVIILKKMTDEFLVANPEYKNDQFLFKKPFYLFTKEFLELLKERKFDQFKDFTSIMLNTENGRDTLFNMICKTCPDEVIKHILDNSIDYDICDRYKLKPLHIACKLASCDIIMHLAKKGVDLNSEDMNGETPLGYLLLHRKDDYSKIIPQFLDLGVDINKLNKSGLSPAHYIINNGDLDMLKVCINHHLNIGLVSPKLNGINLLQYAFRESKSQDLIKYLIDLNVNLDVDVDPRTSCEQLIYMNQHLNKKQKQQLVLNYLTKILNKAEIVEDYMDTVKIE